MKKLLIAAVATTVLIGFADNPSSSPCAAC